MTQIRTDLKSLLEVLDARARVMTFKKEGAGDDMLRHTCMVYELLTDNDFMNTYGGHKVIGLNVTIGTTMILIEE